jgi:glycosyltransferase involved in cell wall biosynthesis
MRISLVTETFPPEVNGVAHTLDRLVSGLTDRGHELQVIRPRQASHNGGLVPAMPGVEQLLVGGGPLPGYPRLRFGFFNRKRLRRVWTMHRPDVTHIATEGPLGLSAVLAARDLGLPVCSSFHTNFHAYGRYYGYGLLTRQAVSYLKYVHNRTDRTLVPSSDTLDALRSRGFQRLGILGRGVDTGLFDPARRSVELRRTWGAGRENCVVLYVGRIAREKNVDLAIKAYEGLREQVPGSRMVFVGNGPYRWTLQTRHPEIHFSGERLGADLATHYASGDIMLFPSLTETFGNVVAEAMASGLPVVAFDYAAARMHIAHGVNGLKARLNDTESFIRLAGVLAEDSTLRSRLGPKARETAVGLSWRSVIDHFENELAQLVENGPGES